jgi:hypothetical protein
MKIYVTGTLSCLQDRSALIRNLAEVFFGEVVEHVGFEAFLPYLKDIKPAVMNNLNSVFEKYRHKSSCDNEPEFILSKPPRSSTSVHSINRSSSKDISRKPSLKAFNEEPKLILKKSKSILSESADVGIIAVGNKEKRLEAESKNK